MKRFKAEKAKIVGCDDSITIATFQKRLIADHPLFGEMIMKKDLTLADSFNEQWFKLPKQLKGDISKLDHTKYCAFHQGPSHTTNDCYTWKNYLEKLVKEGKVDRYLDKPAAQQKMNADDAEKPPTKMIQINGIFVESEHLGAANNSKKKKIQQTLLISQVQVVDTQLGPIIGFIEQDAEDVDFSHDDALVVSVQLAHAIVNRMMVDNGSVVNLFQL
ncbi:uncharacterized protein LOC126631341 [Malus sylvestris]|uniref:uncharacterized protein LOC126631341 n=1 Tax=Malus sylvestris TaxID=3752 RepID=UPI0021ACEC6A|nr:uncharacterized protein LOC126631341 [Malus sylvestris]